jgi:cytidyltransferase-like protein
MFFIHKRFRMLYNMHMKIGIYGGTFDPVHMGHIFVARSVKQELGLDRVDFVVAADPPHKHSAERTPAALRFDMVCAALSANAECALPISKFAAAESATLLTRCAK